MKRVLTAVGFAITALAISVSPALADTEIGHTGRVGRHKLRDKSAMDGTHTFYLTPGATCFYDGVSQDLVDISVKAPKIWARNTTSARNSHTVGYQVIVKRLDDSFNITTFYKSVIATATAYDDAFAVLADGDVETSFLPDSNYFVMIKMFWYRHDAVEGTAKHGVDYYNELIPPVQPQGLGSCPDHYLN
jgi:hypothetical protein